MIIFFTIVTVIYLLVNFYIFSRGVQVFAAGTQARWWFTIVFWFIVSTFIAARILERVWVCQFTGVITWIGSFWLAFMLYFLMAVIVIDLIRLVHNIYPILPFLLTRNPSETKVILFWVVSGLVTVTVAAGYINARNPVVNRLKIHIPKEVPGMDSLKIALASDIHLGTIIRKDKANELVAMLNGDKPDIILLAGDVVDEDLAPVIKDNIGESLIRLQAPLGVYAVTGNHEFIGGADPAVKYLEAHGIRMVRDTAIFIANAFYLAGREDRDKERFTGRKRKELNEVLRTADFSRPVILMDHQPFNLDQTARSGVDLSFSGHTHHGQLWPLNYVTRAIYEISRGYKKIDGTHFYVSNGFGTWGPPVRIGNRPEIVVIEVLFNTKEYSQTSGSE